MTSDFLSLATEEKTPRRHLVATVHHGEYDVVVTHRYHPHSPSRPRRSCPSSGIDSPFRPPGHEPPLSPPPTPSLPSSLSTLPPLSLFKYISVVPQSPFSYTYSSPHHPRAVYLSTHTRRDTHPIVLSSPFRTKRGSSSSTSTPIPTSPPRSPRSHENYVTRALDPGGSCSAPFSSSGYHPPPPPPHCSSLVLPNIISGVPADLPDPEKATKKEGREKLLHDVPRDRAGALSRNRFD